MTKIKQARVLRAKLNRSKEPEIVQKEPIKNIEPAVEKKPAIQGRQFVMGSDGKPKEVFPNFLK